MRVLGFVRGRVKLYLPLEHIRGIYQEEAVFTYPELLDRFLGLVFIRGEIVPVLDIENLIYRVQKEGMEFSPVRKYPILLAESESFTMAFVYDSLTDIYEKSRLKDVKDLIPTNIENVSNRTFFVESIKLLEEIINRIGIDNSRIKEIFLCPKES